MFDMDLHLESSPKTVKLIDFDTCSALGDRGDPMMSHFFALDLVIKNRFSTDFNTLQWKIAIFHQIPWRPCSETWPHQIELVGPYGCHPRPRMDPTNSQELQVRGHAGRSKHANSMLDYFWGGFWHHPAIGGSTIYGEPP